MFCSSHTNGGVRKTRLKMLMIFSLWKITSNIRQLVNSLDRWIVETNLRRKLIDTTTTNSSTSGGSSSISLLLPSDQLLLSILVGRKLFHCPKIRFTTLHIWMEYFHKLTTNWLPLWSVQEMLAHLKRNLKSWAISDHVLFGMLHNRKDRCMLMYSLTSACLSLFELVWAYDGWWTAKIGVCWCTL